MIHPESKAVITFFSQGRFQEKGFVKTETGKTISNAASKEEIHKMMAFPGAIDPETGKFSKTLNIDWYVKNKKPFPKKYYWSKEKYIEPKYFSPVKRVLNWDWEQIQSMLNTPIKMSERAWEKLSDEEKLQTHANQCCLATEYQAIITLIQ